MAIFHLSTKLIARSSGRSAVAAAAYRTQSVLVDERQGLTHDYTRRSGVEHAEIVLPEGADRAYWTRSTLWNAAEAAEVRKDARTAREWELALPEELSPEARQRLAVGFAGELASRYGCAVDVAIHAPGKEGDSRNHHAHLLATTRAVRGQGLGEKVAIELSDAKRLSLGLGQGRHEIEQVRALWAEHSNQALARQGIEQRIDHRSLAVQQEEALTAGDIIRAAALDRMPGLKVGWKATAMERRGVETERGAELRQIHHENEQRRGLRVQIELLQEAARKLAVTVGQGIERLRAGYEAWKQGRQEPREQAPSRGPSVESPQLDRASFLSEYARWKQAKADQEKAREPFRNRERTRDRGLDRDIGYER